MNKIIIGATASILLLGGIVWVARPDLENNTVVSSKNGGVLAVVGSDNYDFGAISMAAGKVAYRFSVKNTGSDEVVIEKIYTSCMCTTAFLMSDGKRLGPYGMPGHGAVPKVRQSVGPNEEAIIEAVFDPAAHGPAGVGKIERSIAIEYGAGDQLELRFAATVTP